MTDEAGTAAATRRQSAGPGRGVELSPFSAYIVALTAIGVSAYFGVWTFLGALSMIVGLATVWRSCRSAAFIMLGFWSLISVVAVWSTAFQASSS